MVRFACCTAGWSKSAKDPRQKLRTLRPGEIKGIAWMTAKASKEVDVTAGGG